MKHLCRWFLSLSLRTHLVLLAVLLALPSIGLIIHAGFSERNESMRSGFRKTRRLVNSIATEQYNQTGNIEQVLTVLAQLPDVKHHNASAVNLILADILKKSPHLGNIVVIDRTGKVWASALPPAKPFSLKDSVAFKHTLKTKRFSSGNYIVGKVSGKSTIGFGYPVFNDRGEIDSVLSSNINFDILSPLLNQADLPKDSSLSIVDRNGVIIYANPAAPELHGTGFQEELFRKMKAGPDRSTFIHDEATGTKRIVAYRKLYLAGEHSPYIYVSASAPLEGVLAAARWEELRNMAILSPFLLAAILLSIVIANVCFIRRIKRLQEASVRLAEGDLQVKVSDLVEGGEFGLLARSFDEMARKLAVREQSLVMSERELEDLYNHAPCGYHSLDENGIFLRINDTALNWLGYARDEVVDKLNFADILTPDGKEAFSRNFPLLKERGWVHDLEYDLVRRDGTRMPVLMNATAVYASDGSFLMTRTTSHDITERKRVEDALNELNLNLAKKVEEEADRRLRHERLLARHARLAAIGEMIGAIAHQWRQPLATLGATIQSIRMAWERRCIDDAFLERAETDAQKQLTYMSETIEDFRNFFRPEKMAEVFNVMEKVKEALLLVSPQFANSGVTLHLRDTTGESPLEIKGFPNEFKQALLNLVSNSFDAITEKNLSNGTTAGKAGDNGLVTVSVARAGDNAVISVFDNGCGIPAEYAEKVFEPYFTTKTKEKGTGLGLYMSRLIIEESMGGQLRFESTPEGTMFRMELARYTGDDDDDA